MCGIAALLSLLVLGLIGTSVGLYREELALRELRAKQIRAEAEGGDALGPEMRKFIEEAKASGVTRCPIRDIEEKTSECPVDFKTVSPEDAKKAVEAFMEGTEES